VKEDFARLPLTPPPNKGGPFKNLYTESERLKTFSCRLNWAWSERVNLYNRLLSTTTKKYATLVGPEPLPDSRAPVVCTGFPPLFSVLNRNRSVLEELSAFAEKFMAEETSRETDRQTDRRAITAEYL